MAHLCQPSHRKKPVKVTILNDEDKAEVLDRESRDLRDKFNRVYKIWGCVCCRNLGAMPLAKVVAHCISECVYVLFRRAYAFSDRWMVADTTLMNLTWWMTTIYTRTPRRGQKLQQRHNTIPKISLPRRFCVEADVHHDAFDRLSRPSCFVEYCTNIQVGMACIRSLA